MFFPLHYESATARHPIWRRCRERTFAASGNQSQSEPEDQDSYELKKKIANLISGNCSKEMTKTAPKNNHEHKHDQTRIIWKHCNVKDSAEDPVAAEAKAARHSWRSEAFKAVSALS